MDEKIKLLKGELGDLRVKSKVDTAQYLESGLHILTEAFYIATNTRELIRITQICDELKIKFLIIGSGSKTVFKEKEFPGLIIKNRSDNLKIFGIKGKVSRSGIGIEEALVEADSGTSLQRLSSYTEEQKLAGFEGLKTMTGTIGGSILSNSIIREKTHQVKILDEVGKTETKQLEDIDKDDIILSVIFKLKASKN